MAHTLVSSIVAHPSSETSSEGERSVSVLSRTWHLERRDAAESLPPMLALVTDTGRPVVRLEREDGLAFEPEDLRSARTMAAASGIRNAVLQAGRVENAPRAGGRPITWLPGGGSCILSPAEGISPLHATFPSGMDRDEIVLAAGLMGVAGEWIAFAERLGLDGSSAAGVRIRGLLLRADPMIHEIRLYGRTVYAGSKDECLHALESMSPDRRGMATMDAVVDVEPLRPLDTAPLRT